MRLGEISKPESDDLFGQDNPLDRLRKYIKLKLPVYFEHGDDPADAYRDHLIVMANQQNFVYTTKDKGMAYVPWTMPATLYHGGVKMDDWRFVRRNGDWILQQHFSEPKLSPVREESDEELFGQSSFSFINFVEEFKKDLEYDVRTTRGDEHRELKQMLKQFMKWYPLVQHNQFQAMTKVKQLAEKGLPFAELFVNDANQAMIYGFRDRDLNENNA